MRTENFYNRPAGIKGKVKGISRLGGLFLIAMLLLGAPLMAQTYYNVSSTSGTTSIGGNSVTVTNIGSGTFSQTCGTTTEGPYVIGGSLSNGSYTWSFAEPVSSVVAHIDYYSPGDTISVSVNGSFYFLTASNISSFSGGCTFSADFSANANGTITSLTNGSGTLTVSGAAINSVSIQFISGPTGTGVISDFNFANEVPTFVAGNPIYDTICLGSGAQDLSGVLSIADLDAGMYATWSVLSGPVVGTLSPGFPYSDFTTGGIVSPAGLSYTPVSAGSDMFVVEINDGDGDSTIDTVYVYVNPITTMGSVDDTSFCNNTMDTLIFSGVAGETYMWSNDNTAIGLPASGPTSGTGDTLAFTGSNISALPISGDVVVTPYANGCAGSSVFFTITIKPTPYVDTPSHSVCNGSTDSVNFTSPVSSPSFTWTNHDMGTGLGSNGSGNILPYTAVNTTSLIVLDTVSVYAVANSCTSPTVNFVISVDPTPSVSSNVDVLVVPCSGFPYELNLNGPVDGTTYSWTVSNVSITGIGDSTNKVNFPGFSGRNSTAVPLTDTIIITPSANGCIGTMDTAYVTVNPIPQLVTGTTIGNVNFAMCDSVAFIDTLNFTTGSATTYSWSRAAVAGITNPAVSGITASNIINDTLVNDTFVTAIVDYSINLTSPAGCSGINQVYVTVSPRPELTNVLSEGQICSGGHIGFIDSTLTPSVSYYWSSPAIAGIGHLHASGTGNIIDTLTSTDNAPVTVIYIDSLVTNFGVSCYNKESVSVVVNPNPMLSNIVTHSYVCDSSSFRYFDSSSTANTMITWSRDSVDVSNPYRSGIDSVVNEWIVNSTVSPMQVIYTNTLTLTYDVSCSNVMNDTLTVYPKPTLLGLLTQPTICDSTGFTYVPNSATTGWVSTWSRAVIPGIRNAAASGVDTIREILINTTDSQVVVTYTDTLKANGCMNYQNIYDTVNPKPVLSSATSETICDSAVFNYPVASNTIGTVFTWSRPYVLGILEPNDTGRGNPNEQLINTTNFNVVDTYYYTLSFHGCPNTQAVTVLVHPTPLLSSALNETICSGVKFNYNPLSNTPGTKFYWSRPVVPGINPHSASGLDSVRETLIDTESVPVTTVYYFTDSIGGCYHRENVTLLVNPTPPSGTIGLTSPNALCSETFYQNFGAATPAPSGEHYSWSAVNATVYAEGNSKQYALVNFDKKSTTAVVILTTTNTGTTCANNTSTDTIKVSGNSSDVPEVIYTNGEFQCLLNSEAGYQWGYDDASSLAPTSINGEINQVYFNNSPDFTYRYYWVKTTDANGCFQKTYYNAPLSVVNTNTEVATDLKVYPNPTSENINVELNSSIEGNISVELTNLIGQTMFKGELSNDKAAISVVNLPAGCYLVDCFRNGVKIATSKFIKN